MNLVPDVENVLRRAPVLQPPADLKQALVDDIVLPARTIAGRRERSVFGAQSWLARWWPALGAGATSLACAVVLSLQQLSIADLRASVQALATNSNATVSPESNQAVRTLPTQDTLTADQEIERLRQLVVDLSAEVKDLERLAAENASLQSSLAAAPAGLTAEETAALEAARQKALSITCINNLKQLCLAVLLWANDHKDVFPPDIVSMTDKIGTPKLLWCPADSARVPAADWSSYTPANCSYDYLMGDAPAYKEPNRVMFRCPVHGTVGIGDGSVHRAVAQDHPEWLVTRDEKLFLEVK